MADAQREDKLTIVFVSNHLSEKVVKANTHVYRYKDEFGSALSNPKTIDDKLKLASDHYPLFFLNLITSIIGESLTTHES